MRYLIIIFSLLSFAICRQPDALSKKVENDENGRILDTQSNVNLQTQVIFSDIQVANEQEEEKNDNGRNSSIDIHKRDDVTDTSAEIEYGIENNGRLDK